jgi:hypothetical protein
VARANLKFIFENQGSAWNFVDYGLILDKDMDVFAKWLAFSGFGFIFQWKIAWTRSTSHGPTQGAVHAGLTTMAGHGDPGARPSRHSGPRRLATRRGK